MTAGGCHVVGIDEVVYIGAMAYVERIVAMGDYIASPRLNGVGVMCPRLPSGRLGFTMMSRLPALALCCGNRRAMALRQNRGGKRRLRCVAAIVGLWRCDKIAVGRGACVVLR